MKRLFGNITRTFLIFTILFSAQVCSVNMLAGAEKLRIGVLKFFNDSGRPHLNILEMTLREKMVTELKRYAELHVIDSSTIMNRIHKRNLDLRTSLAAPSKLQYIGGLVDADALISGSFILDGDSIIVSTQIYDGRSGQTFKIYRYSGLMSQINLIIEQTAAGLLKEIFIWQQMGGFAESNSMAHKLGKTVGRAEDEITIAHNYLTGPVPKIDIAAFLFNTAELFFTGKMNAVSAIIIQANHLLRNTVMQSTWTNYYHWLFFLAGEHYYAQNEFERAQELWNRAGTYVLNSPLISYRTALFHLQQHNYPLAITLFSGLLKRYPDKISLYVAMARALTGQKDYASAILFARRGLEISPDNKELLILLADTYVQTNKIEQAIGTLKDGLLHFPNDPDIIKLLSTYLKLMPAS